MTEVQIVAARARAEKTPAGPWAHNASLHYFFDDPYNIA